MADPAPIGVFDSGVGGLSVLREIRARMPGESLLYLADSGHVPYGEKSPEYIRERCRRIADFLLGQGAKALVVACNTATAAAVGELRERHPDLPVVGMEPAVKPAAAATRSGVVGVLATTGTLRSARFAALLDRFASNVRVVTQPCPGLVELIEAGQLDGAETRALLERFTAPLLEAGCDTLILGCTHYPFVAPLLRRLQPAGHRGAGIDQAHVRRQQALLEASGRLGDGGGAVRFWSTGDTQLMQAILPLLWGEAAAVDACPY